MASNGAVNKLEDDLIVLHEDIFDENVDGVKEIVEEYKQAPEELWDILTRETQLDEPGGDLGYPLSALHLAALVGNTHVLRSLLPADLDLDVNRPLAHNGYTPLHFSASAGQTNAASFLSSNGACVDAVDIRGQTAVHMAASRGYVDLTKILSVRGAKMDVTDDRQRTPLHYACLGGHLKMATYLLKRGCEVEPRDKDGNAPVHLSEGQGHRHLTRLLLLHGAAVNVQNSAGDSVLHVAVRNHSNSQESMKKQLSLGSSEESSSPPSTPVTSPTSVMTSPLNGHAHLLGPGLQGLLRAGPDLCLQNRAGDGVLHVAAAQGDVTVVEQLLTAGCDVTLRNRDGETAVFQAHSLPVLTMLWRLCGEINDTDNSGNTLLHKASHHQDMDPAAIDLLIDNGIDKNRTNSQGRSALMEACVTDQGSKVLRLLRHGADVTLREGAGKDACMLLVERGLTDLAAEVLRRGDVTLDDVDGEGNTLLHYCVLEANSEQNTSLIEELLERNPNTNTRNRQGHTAADLAVLEQKGNVLARLLAGGGRVTPDKHSDTFLPFHVLIQSGHSQRMRTLCAQGADVSIADPEGRSALHFALIRRDFEAAGLLLALGARPVTSDILQETPLQVALEQQAPLSVICDVIQAGAPLTAQNLEGDSLLHTCVRHHDVTVLDLLVQHGAPVALSNNLQRHVLHQVTCQPRPQATEKLKLLLQTGAGDVINMADQGRRTALYYAVEHELSECVDLLLLHGADCNCAADDDVTALHVAAGKGSLKMVKSLLASKVRADVADSEGRTAVFYAIKSRNVRVLQSLLDYNINVNHSDKKNRHLLTYAIQSRDNNLTLSLLQRGDLHIHLLDKDGRTPLHQASGLCNAKVICKLLEKGADVGVKDTINSKTALHYAVQNNDVKCTTVLLNNGADPNAADREGNSCVMLAVERGSYEQVELLLAGGGQVDHLNHAGQNAAHLVTSEDVLELLIAHEIDVDTQDDAGHTPLHLALTRTNFDLTATLLDTCSDVTLTDGEGDTYLHVALRSGAREMVALVRTLIKRGAALDARNKEGITPLR